MKIIRKICYLSLLLLISGFVLNNFKAKAKMVPDEGNPYSYYRDDLQFIQISLGYTHSIALTSDRLVYVFGDNKYGQLGNGLDISSNAPINITNNFIFNSGEFIEKLSLGHAHSAALTNEGRLFVWGLNFAGQVGDGTTINRNLPIDITKQFKLINNEKIIDVTLGYDTSMVLTSEGRLFTWGSNLFGQLGNGTRNNNYVPQDITKSFNLTDGDRIDNIAIGFSHAAVVTTNGRVFTWGNNSDGQLGDNTLISRYYPSEVTNSFIFDHNYLEDKIIKVSLGNDFSSALSSRGQIFTWGKNDAGQLGVYPNYNDKVPSNITYFFNLPFGETITDISLGNNHGVAITQNGLVYTWGKNNYGQLGNDTLINRDEPINITSFFKLKVGEKLLGISAKDDFSFSLSNNGQIYSWGYNKLGNLGVGNNIDQKIPTLVKPDYLTVKKIGFTTEKFKQFSVGNSHIALLTENGSMYTWGRNFAGQLGDGTKTESIIPNNITENFNLDETEKIIKIGLGGNDSAALTSSGRLFMMGPFYGELPNDITTRFDLMEDEKLVDISLGSYHLLAITDKGRLFAFGYNTYGQLGNGTNIESNIPIDVTKELKLRSGETIRKMQAGGIHSGVVTSNGRILIWGYNAFGQLGDGTLTDRNQPVDISNNFRLAYNDKITDIYLGVHHSAAVTSYGYVYIWGKNTSGQIGDGTTNNKLYPTHIPIPLTFNDDVVKVSLGDKSSAALSKDGRVFVWGEYPYKKSPMEITSEFQLAKNEKIIDVTLGDLGYTAITNQNNVYVWGTSNLMPEVGNTLSDMMRPHKAFCSALDVAKISTYLLKENYDVQKSLTLSIFPTCDLSKELQEISINGEIYQNFVLNNGRIDVKINNRWDAGQELTFTVDSLTFINNVVIKTTGNNTVNTKIIADTTPPTFDYIYPKTIELGSGVSFNWLGFIRNEHDNVENTLTKVLVSDDVDYDKPGTYKVVVKLVDESLNETTQIIYVIIEDTKKPIIKLNPGIDTVEVGSTWVDAGITVEDHDKQIELLKTGSVNTNVPGVYIITYTANDSSGNNTTAYRYVHVVKKVEEIKLILNPGIDTITFGQNWTDAGCYYLINDQIYQCNVKENNVKSKFIGVYRIIYEVQVDEQVIEKIRYVHVLQKTGSVTISYVKRKEEDLCEIYL